MSVNKVVRDENYYRNLVNKKTENSDSIIASDFKIDLDAYQKAKQSNTHKDFLSTLSTYHKDYFVSILLRNDPAVTAEVITDLLNSLKSSNQRDRLKLSIASAIQKISGVTGSESYEDALLERLSPSLKSELIINEPDLKKYDKADEHLRHQALSAVAYKAGRDTYQSPMEDKDRAKVKDFDTPLVSETREAVEKENDPNEDYVNVAINQMPADYFSKFAKGTKYARNDQMKAELWGNTICIKEGNKIIPTVEYWDGDVPNRDFQNRYKPHMYKKGVGIDNNRDHNKPLTATGEGLPWNVKWLGENLFKNELGAEKTYAGLTKLTITGGAKYDKVIEKYYKDITSNVGGKGRDANKKFYKEFLSKVMVNGKIDKDKFIALLEADPKNYSHFVETLLRAVGNASGGVVGGEPPKHKIETFERYFRNDDVIGYNNLVRRVNGLSSIDPKDRLGKIRTLKESAQLLKAYLEKAKENSGPDIHRFLEQKLVNKLDHQINILIETIEFLEKKEEMLEKAKVNLEEGIKSNNPDQIGLIGNETIVKDEDGQEVKQIVYQSIADIYKNYLKEKEKEKDESFKHLSPLAKLTQFKNFFLKDRAKGLSESAIYLQMELEARYEQLKQNTGGTFKIKDSGDLLEKKPVSRDYKLLSDKELKATNDEIISNTHHDSLKVQNRNTHKHFNNMARYENLRRELMQTKKEYDEKINAKNGNIQNIDDPQRVKALALKLKTLQEQIEKLIGHGKKNEGEYGKIIHTGTRNDKYEFPASKAGKKITNNNAFHGRVANAMVLGLVERAKEVKGILSSNESFEADLTKYQQALKRSLKVAQNGPDSMYAVRYEVKGDGKNKQSIVKMQEVRANAPYRGRDEKWCRDYLIFDEKLEKISDQLTANKTPSENQLNELVRYLEAYFPESASAVKSSLEKLQNHLRAGNYSDAQAAWGTVLAELNDNNILISPAERIDMARQTFLLRHQLTLDKNVKPDSATNIEHIDEIIEQRRVAGKNAEIHLELLERDYSNVGNQPSEARIKQELRIRIAKNTADQAIQLIENFQSVVDIENNIATLKNNCNGAGSEARKSNYEKMNTEMVKLAAARKTLNNDLLTKFSDSGRFSFDTQSKLQEDSSARLVTHDAKAEYATVTDSKNKLIEKLNEKYQSAFINYATIAQEQAYLDKLSALYTIADDDTNKKHPFEIKKDNKTGERKFKDEMAAQTTFEYLSQNSYETAQAFGAPAGTSTQAVLQKMQSALGLNSNKVVNAQLAELPLGSNGAITKDSKIFNLIIDKIKILETKKAAVQNIQRKYLNLNNRKTYNPVEETRKDRDFIDVTQSEQNLLKEIGDLEIAIRDLEKQLYVKAGHLQGAMQNAEVPLREWGVTRTFANVSLGLKFGSSTQDGIYGGGEMGIAGRKWVLMVGGQGSVPRITSTDTVGGSSSSGNTTNVTTGESEKKGGNNSFALSGSLRYFLDGSNPLINFLNINADVTGSKTSVKGNARTISNTQVTGSITINSTLPVGAVSYAATNTFTISLPGLPATTTVTLNSVPGTSVNLTGPGPHSVNIPTLFNPLPPNPTPIVTPTTANYAMSLSFNGQSSTPVTATITRSWGGAATIQFSGQLGSFTAVTTATTNATVQETTEQQTYTGRITAEAGKRVEIGNSASLLLKAKAGLEGDLTSTTVNTDTTAAGVTTTTTQSQETRSLSALFGATVNLDYKMRENIFIFIFGYTRAQKILGIKDRDQFIGAVADQFNFGKDYFFRLALSYDLLINTFTEAKYQSNAAVLRQHRWEAALTFGKKMQESGFEFSLFMQQNREYALAAFGSNADKVYNSYGIRAQGLFKNWTLAGNIALTPATSEEGKDAWSVNVSANYVLDWSGK